MPRLSPRGSGAMSWFHCVWVGALVACSCPSSSGGSDSGTSQCNAVNNFCQDAGQATDAGLTTDSGATCDAVTCSTGCCDRTGACQPSGSANNACGTGGGACVDCTATGRVCVAYMCAVPDAGTGADAGSSTCTWDNGNWDQCQWAP